MVLGQAERVVRAVRADLQRVQRQPQVVDRRRGRREVVDEVDRLVDEVGLDDVGVDVDELRNPDVLDVRERPGLQVVDADHAMTPTQQLVAQMRPEEAGAAGHKTCGHDHQAYGLRPRNGLPHKPSCGASRRTSAACSPRPPRAPGARPPRSTAARSPQPLAIAGDPAGNGVAVLSGATADSPLLLVQRDSVAAIPDGVAFAWNAPSPFPGGVRLVHDEHAARPGRGRRGRRRRRRRARRALPRRRHRPVRGARPRRRRPLPRRRPRRSCPANFDRLSDPAVAISAGRHDRDRLRRHARLRAPRRPTRRGCPATSSASRA